MAIAYDDYYPSVIAVAYGDYFLRLSSSFWYSHGWGDMAVWPSTRFGRAYPRRLCFLNRTLVVMLFSSSSPISATRAVIRTSSLSSMSIFFYGSLLGGCLCFYFYIRVRLFHVFHRSLLLLPIHPLYMIMASSSNVPSEADIVVRVSGANKEISERRATLSLVARIFDPQPPNHLVIQQILSKLWGLTVGLVVFEAGFGLFRIVFPTKSDRDRALAKQPWPFRKYLLNLQAWEPPTQALYDRMASMSFWVQLKGVPHDFCTIDFGQELMQQLGEILDVGIFGSRTSAGYFLKVKILLDVTLSFRGRLMADSGESSSPGVASRFWVYLCYERLPPVCYR
ncbi:unnamed protein product [Linum trigynum]|uniref:DUF4283 domain-containing protein n=1 Tax=Linum trigynum TaxID=586398 RepID=A0AAV2E6U0_9ROSI